MSIVGKWVRLINATPMFLIGMVGEVIEESGDHIVVTIPHLAPWDRRIVLSSDVKVVPTREIIMLVGEEPIEEELKHKVSLENKCVCGKPVCYLLSVDFGVIQHHNKCEELPCITVGRCTDCVMLFIPNMCLDDNEVERDLFATVRFDIKKVSTD